MALLPILRYPDPRLYKKARPVLEFDQTLARLVADMLDTMYAADGIGLAAIQVDVALRIVVVDLSKERSDPKTFINPVLVELRGVREHEEGCLSVPGIYDKVTRADGITLRAQHLDGSSFTLETDGLLATCLQHEIDHLDGKVFVDYLSALKQSRIKTKLRKRARDTF
ncbi:MAG: peptide deformylase [Betaproteobacteria bacterium]|jgi:peptide deformylase (EC 3.5.1.88)|nr:peptide deformylase [Betaproteobacteria bacterium]